MNEEPPVIAFGNIPHRWTLKMVAKALTPYIHARFAVLDFEPAGKNKPKVAYVRLPQGMNVGEVLQTVKVVRFKKDTLHGFWPTNVPPNMLARKGRTMDTKSARRLHVSLEDRAEVLLARTHGELLRELQTKYLALFPLSRDHAHHPLDYIAETIWQRLYVLVPTIPINLTCHNLSSKYRREHPHSSDMKLIVECLHRAQSHLGVSQTSPTEKELINIASVAKAASEIPALEAASSKYLYKINNKVMDHIHAMNANPFPQPTEEQRATSTVRGELKKLLPIIEQVTYNMLTKELFPNGKGDFKMRIYGEPYMPARDKCEDFTKRFHPRSISRSQMIYNCVWLTISPGQYDSFMASDGTRIDNAKLICRPSEVPLYKLRGALAAKMRLPYAEQPYYNPDSAEHPPLSDDEDMEDNGAEENGEQWE